MKLECTIKRPGGSDVELPPYGNENKVQFRPLDHTRAESPHVAEVTAEQLQFLIGLDPRTYRVFDGKAPAVVLNPPSAPPPAPPTGGPIPGSSEFPLLIDIAEGIQLPISDIVRSTFEASGLDENGWGALSEEERTVKIQAMIEALKEKAGGGKPDDDDADANGDGVLSVRELKAGIQNKTLNDEALRDLLEKENLSQTPRQSFIDVIMRHLKS